MKILLISPHFWPSNDPRSNRWSALAAYWAERGHELCVLTARYGDRPVRERWSGVSICRKAHKNIQSLLVRPGERERALGSSRFRLFYRLNEFLWKPLHWPDASALWYLPARRQALRLAAEWQPDVLISVALPMTAHAVALSVKRDRPGLFWLADWGDPFSLQKLCPPNNRSLYGAWNRRLERTVFRLADAHVFTTAATLRAYAGLYPEASVKGRVVPPVLSLPVGEPQTRSGDFPMGFRQIKEPERPLRLAYFGTFTPRLREPETILRLLDIWQRESGRRLELHLYGRLPEPFHPLLRSHPFLHHHGLMAREKVPAEMEKADALLSVGNRSPLQLPGKSVEYLASGLPVLHFQEVAEDPVCEMFAGIGHFCALPAWNEGESLRLMAAFLEKLPSLIREVPEQKLHPYLLPQVAAAYERLLPREKKNSCGD